MGGERELLLTFEEAWAKSTRKGGGQPIPSVIYPCYVAEVLGLNAAEMDDLSAETAAVYMGYVDGKSLAGWVAEQHGKGAL